MTKIRSILFTLVLILGITINSNATEHKIKTVDVSGYGVTQQLAIQEEELGYYVLY